MGQDAEVPLREYLETHCRLVTGVNQEKFQNLNRILEEQGKQFSLKIAWLEESNRAAALALDKRLEGMNNFRQFLRDQSTGFFTRTEHEAYQKIVETDLRLLREARAEMLGKASQSSANLALLLGLIGSFIGIISFVIQLLKDFAK